MEKTSGVRIGVLAISITGITLFHYFTPIHISYLHDIFQRLYYLPIILAALWFGLRGGLLCSVAVSCLYAPHILYQWGGEWDMEAEKYLEILLYNTVGGITGVLSQRERQRTSELQKTAKGLKESLEQQKAQSEKIIAIEEQLRRAEKLSTVGELSAVLAHEIRNPLGSIRGTAEILRDDYPPGSPKHEFIEIQIRETERLNRVVEDFLNMVRQQPHELEPCNIQEELETIITLVSSDARSRNVELELSCPVGSVVVLASSDKLRQAFLNIVINAMQATPPGGRVLISTRSAGEEWIDILFHDGGPGVDEETRERMFEPFFTTRPDGTGLGLAITRKIVESFGGTIDLESSPGKGTTVRIRFPLQPSTSTQQP
jgi:two-component system sensor histidine kinase HydH